MKTKRFMPERIAAANELLREIAGCGRNFFKHGERISQFELLDAKYLGFRDAYTDCVLLCRSTKTKSWHRYFTEGGTLLALVEALIEYILNGQPVAAGHFGPWPSWFSDGDLWGYGDAMEDIRAKAKALSIIVSSQAVCK